MEKEKWYFIDSGKQSPAYNMAMDEMLLRWHSEGKIPPVVRFTAGIRLLSQSAIFKRYIKISI